MPGYSLNFDLHDAETGDYERLKKLLNTEYNNVVDGEVESTFEFNADCEYPELVKKKLEGLLSDLRVTFTVINLDSGKEARGESDLAHHYRLANYPDA